MPITGQQVLAKVHPDDLKTLKDPITALSPEKPYLHVSYRMIRPDNSVIWVERSSCGDGVRQRASMARVNFRTARDQARTDLSETQPQG